MAASQYVEIVRRDAVATVTVRRPEVHNAFNERVIAELNEAFDAVSSDDDVRVVVLAGGGRSFSAGADLDWMRRAAAFSEEENRRDAAALAKMLRAMAECPRPVVARVQGSAFGGGAGLVAASDIAVAAASARFGFTETRLGLVPATIAPHVIEKIGPGWALRLFLTGERFDAARALSIGLVYRVVPDEELDVAIDDVVATLLAGGPQAQRACKELVRRVAFDSQEIDEYTSELIARVRSSDEGREGVLAFLEKRDPRWLATTDV
jgi:methylglutaconyl-CoA hydratase